MAVDVSCSHCGREPSHPQVRNRFVYAAYYHSDLAFSATPRNYIAALCEPCYEADRQAKIGTARNRFLARVRRWSGLPGNQHRIVRLLEHPEGVTGDEHESEHCFQDGATRPYSAVATEGKS
jgi:hypothetical protein